MSKEYYLYNKDLGEYFNSLPVAIQDHIANYGGEISTLGELMKCAQHLMDNDFNEK